MTKNELEAAIRVAEVEITRVTHETIRPNQGFKMRTHAPIIASMIDALTYYKAELAKLPKAKPSVKKED